MSRLRGFEDALLGLERPLEVVELEMALSGGKPWVAAEFEMGICGRCYSLCALSLRPKNP